MKLFSPIGLVILALLLGACAEKKNAGPTGPSAKKPQRVEVVTLERVDIQETLEVAGSLEANESVALRPELSGIVRSIDFEEGQTVEKGQLLATLDDAELKAQVAEAEARAGLARLNRERTEALLASRSVPQSDYDRVHSEEKAAAAALALLRVRLERTSLRAPMSGTIGARSLAIGDYATPNSTLATLEDIRQLKVTFLVPERSVMKVRPGTRITARVRVGESQVETEGEVFFVSASIDPAVRANQVKALLKSPPPELRPGMFASVRIVLETRPQVLVVPEAALLASTRGLQVIAVAGANQQATARFVNVESGLRSTGRVEIRPVAPATLEAGESIVASGVGALALFPGAPLDPRPLTTVVRSQRTREDAP